MSITIDDQLFDAATSGLLTVGQVLERVQAGQRLVVQCLIDGIEPDFDQMEELRATPLSGRTLFIETVAPGTIARDVLAEVDATLEQFDAMRLSAGELFRQGDSSAGLAKLAECFRLWQQSHDAIASVTQLLGADLDSVTTPAGHSIRSIISAFADQLRQLKEALETRDYVLCCDVLTYDMERTTEDFRLAGAALRKLAA